MTSETQRAIRNPQTQRALNHARTPPPLCLANLLGGSAVLVSVGSLMIRSKRNTCVRVQSSCSRGLPCLRGSAHRFERSVWSSASEDLDGGVSRSTSVAEPNFMLSSSISAFTPSVDTSHFTLASLADSLLLFASSALLRLLFAACR